MQIISVFIAAAACWGVGAIYYSVLANPWLKATNRTKEEVQNGSATPYIISLIAIIIATAMMRHIFASAGITTIGAGAIAGAGIGAFMVGAWIFINNAYEDKGFDLSLINTGYSTIGLASAGAVLGYFL